MGDMKPMSHLENLRKDIRLTQNDMASKIGVSVSYYTKVEGGFKEPSYQFLKKVKKTFGEKANMNLFF